MKLILTFDLFRRLNKIFVNGGSIAILTNFICESLDAQEHADVVYIDFSRAFDTINRELLLNKLHCFEFSHVVLEVVSSYMLNKVFITS